MFTNSADLKFRRNFGNLVLSYRNNVHVISLKNLNRVELSSDGENVFSLDGYYKSSNLKEEKVTLLHSNESDDLNRIRLAIFKALGWSFGWVKKASWIAAFLVIVSILGNLFTYVPDKHVASVTPSSKVASATGSDIEKAKEELKASLLAKAGDVQDFAPAPSGYKFNPQITPLPITPPELKCATKSVEQIKK